MLKDGSKVYETFSAFYGSRSLQNQLRELKLTVLFPSTVSIIRCMRFRSITPCGVTYEELMIMPQILKALPNFKIICIVLLMKVLRQKKLRRTCSPNHL